MPTEIKKKSQEASFTLIEVIISVGMLTAVVLQMAGGQGSVFGMIDYAQRANEATWLAKRLMSQVEYFASYLDFKELESAGNVKDQPFKLEREAESDYLYSVEIKEWKLPLFDLITGGGPKPKDEKEQEEWKEKQRTGGNEIPGLDEVINQIFEGQILKVAHVEVSWPEGATRNKVGLTMLLTNQKKLDEFISTKKTTWEGIKKKALGNQGQPPPPPPRLDANGNPIPDGGNNGPPNPSRGGGSGNGSGGGGGPSNGGPPINPNGSGTPSDVQGGNSSDGSGIRDDNRE